MGRVSLLDCTLRDGGYVNDWRFGQEAIRGFGKKIAQTGIEMFEIGFIKGDSYDPDRAVFPDIASFTGMISPKSSGLIYVGMLDMSAPVPLDRIPPYDGTSIDAIRVIFKKDRISEAFAYGRRIKELGYLLFMNFVSTDQYSDKAFIDGIEMCNALAPYGVAIVDSFGSIKRKQFLKLVYIADSNLKPGIMLCYHAHNNLQQALGNAEAFVEMNLKRDICLDACVFGMGRGAGNLNLELFAGYMNENYGTHYRIEPMLEIMDEYLGDIYKSRFWGYSLPLFLSASNGCHPNYAIYLAGKNALTVKSFSELLKKIPSEDKVSFSKEKAEAYYRQYSENYTDDKATLQQLSEMLKDRRILLLAPGRSLTEYETVIRREIESSIDVVIAVNFLAEGFHPDFIFSSNMRRYGRIQGRTQARCIITSNLKEYQYADYVVNFSSFASANAEIIDNSALMLLRLLEAIGVKDVTLAGMDGYSLHQSNYYYDRQLEYDFSKEAGVRNQLISAELNDLQIRLHFITPTLYDIKGAGQSPGPSASRLPEQEEGYE